MKKLISLLVAVAMVMCMATVAFAAEVEDQNYQAYFPMEMPNSVTLAAGQSANISLYNGAAQSVMGGGVEVTGTGEGTLTTMFAAPLEENGGVYTASGSFFGPAMMGYSFTITNTGSAEATYEIAYVGPIGSAGNPAPVDAGEDQVVMTNAEGNYEYNFKYTAGETPEIVTVSNVTVTAGDTANIVPAVMMNTESGEDAVLENGAASVGLYAGETVTITITLIEQEYETSMGYADATFDLVAVEAPAGAKVNPIEVDAAGDYVVEGDEVWYAVNSRLAGYIVVATGDDASMVVGDDTINAVDGVATAVLNGEGAVIPVVVYNAADMIIMAAPIEIDAAGDYTADVAAGAEVEYAINSMLAGAILTVEGEDAYILVGTTKYEAVDGVATAVLDGTGATIAVKIGNAGTAAAQYALNIAYAPTAINAAGDYTADVAAGAEVEYAVNSKLAGAILTVEGEGAYIVMGDTKVTAVDGVASVVLDGEGATIAVKVGNAGTAAAEYALNIAYAPTVITAAGDYTANVGAGAEVEYVVNGKLAGAVLTVKGEGAYIVMGDTKVTAVDGVASVVLDGEGATIAVKVGNAGTAAAEYALNIAYAPTAINAAGDYTADVPAAGEVEYVVNSKLDGAVVTVKGEGAYLVVNGKKVEGKDGVVTATLKAEAATISLVVGNAGNAAAQYTVNVAIPSDIPATGDMGVVMSVAALAMSAIGGVAVVAKKKEF